MNVDTTQKYPNVLSLCTGYGGIEIGLERIFGKCTILTHVEIEAFAIANLVDKMEAGQMDPAPIWTDLKTFRPRIFRGCVDILTGGYPCQPFSAAGKKQGEKDPRHLWPYIRKAIFGCRPGQVFLENVEGHLNLGIDKVLKDLERMGYRSEVGIFSAVEVGAPHQRKRVFILADSSESRAWNIPGKVGCKTWPKVLRQGNGEECTIRIDSASSDLANSIGDGSGKGCLFNKPKLFDKNDEKRGNVSDAYKPGLQKCWHPGEIRKNEIETCPTIAGSCNQWPSRPGEPQHEWEEPRVVANSNGATSRIDGEHCRGFRLQQESGNVSGDEKNAKR